jgi:hypothetical protein
MKKLYISPASRVVRLRAHTILAGSPANTYSNNEGTIRYNPTEVSAEDAD